MAVEITEVYNSGAFTVVKCGLDQKYGNSIYSTLKFRTSIFSILQYKNIFNKSTSQRTPTEIFKHIISCLFHEVKQSEPCTIKTDMYKAIEMRKI